MLDSWFACCQDPPHRSVLVFSGTNYNLIKSANIASMIVFLRFDK